MGIEAAAAALAIGAVTGASNYYQASQRNKSLRSAEDSARNAASVQQKQLVSQSETEREKAIRQARAIRGRALVSAAESGFALDSGDIDALLNAINSDAEINLNILRDNTKNSTELVQSRLAAQLAEYNGQTTSPFSSAFSGAIGGVGSGLGVANRLKILRDG